MKEIINCENCDKDLGSIEGFCGFRLKLSSQMVADNVSDYDSLLEKAPLIKSLYFCNLHCLKDFAFRE